MLKWLCLLGLPIAIMYVRKYEFPLKKKYLILVLGFCFSMVPFTNNKPAPVDIMIKTEPMSIIVLGKDMVKKTNVVLTPANADINKLEFISDDYSVAYIENGNIHSASEGKTKVYAKYKDVVSNEITVIVDYSKYRDVSAEEGYVFMTSSGNKYHTSNCNVINPKVSKVTEEQAKSQGAEPCKSCLGE